MVPVSLASGGSFTDDAFLARWLDQEPDALLVTDASGVIEYVNPAFEALTGYARAEVVGRKPSLLKSGEHDGEFYRGLWRTVLAGRAFRAVLVNRRKSGALFHAESLIWPVLDDHGRIAHLACEMRDVSTRVGRAERLAHAATHDPLTDLPNRTLFLDRLGSALRQAARRSEGVAVGIFDIDRFRDINNRFGHLAGDAVLQAVARRSARSVRDADTVARIGGDELAVILPGPTQRAEAAAVLEKIRLANAVPVRYDSRLIHVGVSIGGCLYPRDGTDTETLRKHADSAMYAAKRAGGNCVRFYRWRRPAQGGCAKVGGCTRPTVAREKPFPAP
jgi:diguanylate cyclase (GGDEF)-like protein/PAS domain S-box-containing protein